jgi:hypothetical protein
VFDVAASSFAVQGASETALITFIEASGGAPALSPRAPDRADGFCAVEPACRHELGQSLGSETLAECDAFARSHSRETFALLAFELFRQFAAHRSSV